MIYDRQLIVDFEASPLFVRFPRYRCRHSANGSRWFERKNKGAMQKQLGSSGKLYLSDANLLCLFPFFTSGHPVQYMSCSSRSSSRRGAISDSASLAQQDQFQTFCSRQKITQVHDDGAAPEEEGSCLPTNEKKGPPSPPTNSRVVKLGRPVHTTRCRASRTSSIVLPMLLLLMLL